MNTKDFKLIEEVVVQIANNKELDSHTQLQAQLVGMKAQVNEIDFEQALYEIALLITN